MKREYVTPSAYFEMFTPNQFADGCQPGISEDGLKPVTQQCYFYDHSGSSVQYSLASSSSCRQSRDTTYNGTGSCSHLDASLTCITTAASCTVKFETGETSVKTIQMSLDNGTVQPVYVWSNMKGGYHKMPTSMLKVDNPVDGQGRPYYFNS